MLSHRSLFKSFVHSFEGVAHAVRENQNMRIHLAIAVFVMLASVILGATRLEMAILVVMIVFVVMAEMINTALEEMVDLIVAEHRLQAKIAKDVASGMVLIASVGSVIVGILIFTPYILRLF